MTVRISKVTLFLSMAAVAVCNALMLFTPGYQFLNLSASLVGLYAMVLAARDIE